MNTSRPPAGNICNGTSMVDYQLACNGEGFVMIQVLFRIDPGCLQGDLSSINGAYTVRKF